MKYCFYAKKNVDYSKYGFHHSDGQWVIWRSTRRITIKDSDMSMSFNCPTNEIFKIFMDMVRDDVVIVKEWKDKPRRYHYINLDDDEYQMILKKRGEAEYND